MSDEEIQELTRQARLGDEEAAKRLRRARIRAGLPAVEPKPEPQIWTCAGPMDSCNINHKSEITALKCCAKYGRKNKGRSAYWRLPHKIECNSLIRGANAICNCGASERARARLPHTSECQYIRRGNRYMCDCGARERVNPESKHEAIERKFKEWAARRMETDRPISARYASFLVAQYRKHTGISAKNAREQLIKWGLLDLVTPPPWHAEVMDAPPELREILINLWNRRDGNLGWD